MVLRPRVGSARRTVVPPTCEVRESVISIVGVETIRGDSGRSLWLLEFTNSDIGQSHRSG